MSRFQATPSPPFCEWLPNSLYVFLVTAPLIASYHFETSWDGAMGQTKKNGSLVWFVSETKKNTAIWLWSSSRNIFHQRSFSVDSLCPMFLPLKVFFHQRPTFIKGHLNGKPSSMEGCPPSKVIFFKKVLFHRRSSPIMRESPIKVCIP